jgi:hypothetical protein
MTQPEALRLADRLDCGEISYTGMCKAAAELRRLHESNQELLVQRDELIEINRELLAALTGLTSATRSAIAKGEAK